MFHMVSKEMISKDILLVFVVVLFFVCFLFVWLPWQQSKYQNICYGLTINAIFLFSNYKSLATLNYYTNQSF